MNLTQLLKNALPETFPLVSKGQLEKLWTEWQAELIGLSRRLACAPASMTSGQRARLDSLGPIMGVLFSNVMSQASAKPENIHSILSRCESIDKAIRLNAWADYLADALKYENDPLPLLTGMDTGSPLQFAGLLLCLFRKRIAVDDLLTSGLLHRFFSLNCIRIDDIVETYELLAAGVKDDEPCYPETRILLYKIAETGSAQHSPKVGISQTYFENYALNGQRVSSPLPKTHVIEKTFTFTECPKNLTNLYLFFGQDFLIHILYQYTVSERLFLKAFLFDVLDSMSVADTEGLYRFICTDVPEERRASLFIQLGKFLRHEHLAKLLKRGWEWIIIASMPWLIDALTTEQLNLLARTPLTTINFKYAALLCSKPQFAPFLSEIYLHIFKLFLANPHLLTGDQEPLIHTMRMHMETVAWCYNESSILRQELVAEIVRNSTPFTIESYNKIYDAYRLHKDKRNVLRNLSIQKLDYPQGNYELQSFIIRELFNINAAFNIKACLDIFHSTDSYSSYTEIDIKIAKCRTLYECLAIEDHPLLQGRIIDLLKTTFEEDDWVNASLDGAPLISRALQHGNRGLLQHYFPADLSEDLRFAKLQEINSYLRSSKNQSLIEFVKDKPSALTLVLSLYPRNKLLETIKEKDITYGFTVLHRALENPAALQKILLALPEADVMDALKVKSNHGHTVLDLAADLPEALGSILEALPAGSNIIRFGLFTSVPTVSDTSVNVMEFVTSPTIV